LGVAAGSNIRLFVINTHYGLTWDSTTVPNGSHSIGRLLPMPPGTRAPQSSRYTVSNAPPITALSPASGLVGTAVEITGTNFGTTVRTVTLNGDADDLERHEHQRAGAGRRDAGPVVVTVNGQASNGMTLTVTSATALTIDRVIFSDGRGTRTTAAFGTPAPGDLLVAFVASDGPTSGGQSVTISGAGVTWTPVKRSNGRLGTSEIWQAPAATQLSNVTVRSTQRFSGYDQSLTVVAFGNAAGAGASVAGSAASGAPSVSMTTKAASLVYGVGNDWDRAVGRTLGANQTSVHQ